MRWCGDHPEQVCVDNRVNKGGRKSRTRKRKRELLLWVSERDVVGFKGDEIGIPTYVLLKVVVIARAEVKGGVDIGEGGDGGEGEAFACEGVGDVDFGGFLSGDVDGDEESL